MERRNLGSIAFVVEIHFKLITAAIFLNFWDVSENEGLDAGSEDQQLSIRDFHSGSHQVGILGRMVLFMMPPRRTKSYKHSILALEKQWKV